MFMDQTSGSQNKNIQLSKTNQVLLIIAAVVVIGAIIYTVNRDGQDTADQNTNQETSEQTSGQNGQNQEQNTNAENNQQQNGNETSNVQGSTVGNVTASGTLLTSDNPSRGNLMIDSNRGKIYVSTVRDFSRSLNQPVTLQAEGTINQFVFLGFAESMGAVAGAETAAVSFTGTLNNSDNLTKGNYTITSGSTKVYLKSVHDYSAWVGSTVNLK
ncbi:MAG: hypothetical protein HY545_00840, partial [Candidatus Doudnabacteria bacterium]|nr:hypothetical protein [Candidatus Doudnabacteria bacterium]